MATWITHLRITDLVTQNLPSLDAAAFTIGSIAPDSGMLNPDRHSYSPPRKLLHWTSDDGRTIYYDNFAFKYLAGYRDAQSYGFYFGYYAHLFTDDVWAKAAYLPQRRKYEHEIEATNREFILRIKKSWYDLDKIYLKNHTVASFESLKRADHFDGQYLDYITPEMLNAKINEVCRAYDDLSFTPETEYVFITESELDNIISDTAQKIISSLYASRL